MDFFEFLQPVSIELVQRAKQSNELYVGNRVKFGLENSGFQESKLAIIGLCEVAGQFNSVRKEFYQLKNGDWNQEIYDFGDLILSNSEKDNEISITGILNELLKHKFTTIVLSPNSKYAYYQYRAFDSIKKAVQVVGVDHKVSISEHDSELSRNNLLNYMIHKEPQNLYEYSHLGVQRFFTSQEELNLLEQLNFDVFSLGDLTADVKEVEPSLRMADGVYLSLNAIQASNFKSNQKISPNGFSNREICTVAKYVGLGFKTQSFFIGDYKEQEQKADHLLLAQILWYFFDGLNHRILTNDFKDTTQFEQFFVQLPEQEIVFYRNRLNNQWWMNIKIQKKLMQIPCSEQDYKFAMSGNIPKRWWNSLKKSL